jgi:hypothetical protein
MITSTFLVCKTGIIPQKLFLEEETARRAVCSPLEGRKRAGGRIAGIIPSGAVFVNISR